MRRGTELPDADFVDVPRIDEDTIRGGVLKKRVEFEGGDEGAGSGDGRGLRRESDEVRDEADGERGEAAGEGEVRRDSSEGGSRGELEIDGRECEAGVSMEGRNVGAEGGEGAGHSDVHAVGGDAKAAAQGERGAETLEVARHLRGVCEGHELVVKQHAPLVAVVKERLLERLGHG